MIHVQLLRQSAVFSGSSSLKYSNRTVIFTHFYPYNTVNGRDVRTIVRRSIDRWFVIILKLQLKTELFNLELAIVSQTIAAFVRFR